MSGKAFAPCDICNERDGWNGNKIIRCTECNLHVHKECYGFDTYESSTFKCWACRSVGQRFQVEAYDSDGEHISIKQKSRPTRCDLCCVSDGIHAMHPLYDKSGIKARQLHIEDYKTMKKRLVWAHSLCAFVLTAKGFLYGCTQDGGFDGDEDSDASDDERSCNPALEKHIYGDFGDASPVHHFVYPVLKPGKPANVCTKLILDHQDQLKCTICGKTDNNGSVLRIPLQCFANDEDECEKFKKVKHPDLRRDEPCACPLHVGCARWGGGNHRHGPERVYFDPVGGSGVYCTIHAEDIAAFGKDVRKETTKEKNRVTQQPRESHAIAKQPMKGLISSTASKKRPATFNISPSSKKKIRRVPDETVLPSLQERFSKKKRANLKTASSTIAAATKKKNSDDVLGQQLNQHATKKKKKQWHDGLDRNEAVAAKAMQRPKLKNNRRELANKRSVVDESMYEKVLADLMEKAGDTSMDANTRKLIVKGRRTFWKRTLSELTTDNFKEVWIKARDAFFEYLSDAIKSAEAAAVTKPPPPPARKPKPLKKSKDVLGPPKPSHSRMDDASHSQQPIRRKSPTTVDLTLDDDPCPIPTGKPQKASKPVESTQKKVEPAKETRTSEPEETGGGIEIFSDNDEETTPNGRNAPELVSPAPPTTTTTTTSNFKDDRISRSRSEPKIAGNSKPGEKLLRKNPFATLTIGRAFKLGKEFAFDSWDELDEEIII